MKVNGTAVSANVKRFIYISSIKVNGESTEFGKPFKADNQPDPVEPYGVRRQTFWDHLTLFLRDTFLLAASPV